jgi:hypothetical protein
MNTIESHQYNKSIWVDDTCEPTTLRWRLRVYACRRGTPHLDALVCSENFVQFRSLLALFCGRRW